MNPSALFTTPVIYLAFGGLARRLGRVASRDRARPCPKAGE